MYKNYYKVVKLNPNAPWPTEKELVNWCDGGRRQNVYGYIRRRAGDSVFIDVYLKTMINPFESDKPTLVKIYSESCGPCRQLLPIIAEVKAELKEKISLVDLDGPENRDLLKQYKIAKVPTLVYVKDGKVKHIHQGLASASKIKSDILTYLGVE